MNASKKGLPSAGIKSLGYFGNYSLVEPVLIAINHAPDHVPCDFSTLAPSTQVRIEAGLRHFGLKNHSPCCIGHSRPLSENAA